MVRKLYKQELISYTRNLFPIQLILIGLAVLTRFIQLFESNSVGYDITFGSSVIVLCLATVVCLVMTIVICIRRYYKNLFTNEGYLTFTLPATNHQLVISKLLAALTEVLVTVVAMILTILIATAGEVTVEIVKSVFYLFDIYIDKLGIDGVFYLVEFLILLTITLINSFLLFYTCITAGQMAKKHRVLAAVGIYFGYYYAVQILTTIFTVIVATNYEYLNLAKIINFIERNLRESLHLFMIASIISSIVIAAIYYLITQFVLKHKLNLE